MYGQVAATVFASAILPLLKGLNSSLTLTTAFLITNLGPKNGLGVTGVDSAAFGLGDAEAEADAALGFGEVGP